MTRKKILFAFLVASFAILNNMDAYETEPPFSSALLHEARDGVYACAKCGQALFISDTKFDSGSGWPSFSQAVDADAVVLTDDDSFGMHRGEVTCKRCGGHLGHIFPDGPTPTGERWCINSVSIDLDEQA